MTDLIGIIIILGLIFAGIALLRVRTVIVFQHERGLLYRRGIFQRVLTPGSYRLWSGVSTVRKIDVRLRYVTIPGQELLTADNVSIRISLVASFRVNDPQRAVNDTEDYEQALYLLIQLHLRDLVGELAVDDLLARRQEIGTALHERSTEQAAQIGIGLVMVGVKDIMFPGELKTLFAQVVNARKEGQAALERARGETAALRSLANAAQLLDRNPSLLQLRLIQSLSASDGNTVVLVPSFDALRGIAPGGAMITPPGERDGE